MSSTALVLGCNGQVGSYLCAHLLHQGRTVHGMVRHSSNPRQLWRISDILDRMRIWEGDLTDYSSLERVVREVKPDEVYNLADQDSVGYSQLVPLYSVQVTYGGVANLLEVLRHCCPAARMFQPISATIFKPKRVEGTAKHEGRIFSVHEHSDLSPQSPYAVAKAAAWHLCRYYRERHGMYVSCAIPCNHDSPRRNSGYLLGELVRRARLVAEGKAEYLTVGSLDLRVDIGYASEFAAAYIKMLGLSNPVDLVLGTGKGIKISDLAGYALALAGVPYNDQEVHPRVQVDPGFDVSRLVQLVAHPTKATDLIQWNPKQDALGVLSMISSSPIFN